MKAFGPLEELCSNDSRVLGFGFLTGNLIEYLNNTEEMMVLLHTILISFRLRMLGIYRKILFQLEQ